VCTQTCSADRAHPPPPRRCQPARPGGGDDDGVLCRFRGPGGVLAGGGRRFSFTSRLRVCVPPSWSPEKGAGRRLRAPSACLYCVRTYGGSRASRPCLVLPRGCPVQDSPSPSPSPPLSPISSTSRRCLCLSLCLLRCSSVPQRFTSPLPLPPPPPPPAARDARCSSTAVDQTGAEARQGTARR
jgi:hypothetical protein